MLRHHLLRAAWPAFLAACVLELLVFAVVDPLDLKWYGHPLAWSRMGVYSASFFAFWAVSLGCGALTAMLSLPAEQVNRDSMLPEVSPDRDAAR